MFYALYILKKMARKETRRPQNPHKNGRTYDRENWPEKYEKGGMPRSRGHEKIVCNYSGISTPRTKVIFLSSRYRLPLYMGRMCCVVSFHGMFAVLVCVFRIV